MAHGEINDIEFPAGDPERAKALSTGHILRVYVEVDSMDDALAVAERTAGSVKEPKQEILRMGWFAVVIDPEGSEVGLFQSSRAA